jgi:hypothetical protein
MTPELQKYYEDRFSMMATEGWKDLVEDIDNMVYALNNISVIENDAQLQFKKGELSILNWLKNLRDASSELYDQLQKEETYDA